MPAPTPKETAFHAFYLPTFCKVAADHGYPLESPEAIQEALDLTANARALASSQGVSQIKQASNAIKKAFGVAPAKPASASYSKSAAALAEDPNLMKAALALI